MRKLLVAAGVVLGLFAAVCAVAPRLYWNNTASLPKGLYRLTDSLPEKGALVVFDLPEDNPSYLQASERGYTLLRLQKRIMAMPGEAYTLPDVASLDSHGRGMWAFTPHSGVVPHGMAIVQGDTSKSFDSRYYGPVPLRVMQVIVPVWTEPFVNME